VGVCCFVVVVVVVLTRCHREFGTTGKSEPSTLSPFDILSLGMGQIQNTLHSPSPYSNRDAKYTRLLYTGMPK